VRIPRTGVFMSPSKSLRAIFIASALTFTLLALFASAQQTLGSINGTVTDASGAVVQGATIRAHAVATNLEVTAPKQERGFVQYSRLAHRHL